MTTALAEHPSSHARAWLDAARKFLGTRADDLDGLDEEVAHHLERLERDRILLGTPPQRAREEAIRAFGDPARVRSRTTWAIRRERIMLRIIACVVVLAATLTALAGAARLADADWRGVAPFTGFALSADGMLVEYDDAWWRLLAVDGITSENLLATARGTFGDDLAEKRLAGDLHEVLVAAGWDPGGEVDLLLEPESGGEPVLAADVEMNAAKRWRVWRARQTGD